tara:strand:+ start:176 stop:898 length:723 start_codon:yes stop_codon:yes gene_type:complete
MIDKKNLFKSVFYFFNLLKKKKLNSSEKEFFILNKIIKKNENAVDIGANIGRYSFKLSSIVGRKGTVFSFEPVSRIYLILISLIFLKNSKNIIPLNLALSNRGSFLYVAPVKTTSTKKTSFKYNTYTASKIIKNSKPNTYGMKLDDLNFSKKISFIKIDCEGYEFEVLNGGMNLLKKHKPNLLIEFTSTGLLMSFEKTFYGKQKKIINLLKILGYEAINLKLKSRNKLFIHKTNIKKYTL